MRRVGLLVLAGVVLLLAGCGSSGSNSSTPSSASAATHQPLSVSGWRHKANAICSGATKQSEALKKPTAAAQLGPFLQKLVGYGDQEIAEFKALSPPSQFKSTQQAVVNDLTKIWGTLQTLVKQSKSPAALGKAAQSFSAKVLKPAQDYLTHARAAGLTSCVLNTAP